MEITEGDIDLERRRDSEIEKEDTERDLHVEREEMVTKESTALEEQETEIERRIIDILEDTEVTNFLQNGCGCSQKCWQKFDAEYLQETRSNLMKHTTKEKDLVVMGQVMATTFCGKNTSHNRKRERESLTSLTSTMVELRYLSTQRLRIIHLLHFNPFTYGVKN